MPERTSARSSERIIDSEMRVDFDDTKLLDWIGKLVVMVAETGTVLAWNACMKRLTGITPSRIADVTDARKALYGETTDTRLLAEYVLEEPDVTPQKYDLNQINPDLNIHPRLEFSDRVSELRGQGTTE